MDLIADHMVSKHFYSEAAKAYIQLRLSSGGALEEALSRKTIAEEGAVISFLPTRILKELDECFSSDTLGRQGSESREIEALEAGFA